MATRDGGDGGEERGDDGAPPAAPRGGSGRARGALAGVLAAAVLACGLGACGLFKSKPKKELGEDCAADLECASKVCSSPDRICSKDCHLDRDCAGGLVCRAKDTGVGDRCARPLGVGPNSPCMVPTECSSGYCLKPLGGEDTPGVCSRHCAGAEDCPTGMKLCEKVTASGTETFCLPEDDGEEEEEPAGATGARDAGSAPSAPPDALDDVARPPAKKAPPKPR